MRQTDCVVRLFFLLLIYSASPSQPADWRYYGGDAGSTKYSPLAQIHRDNFADLRIIWRWRPPEAEILAEHDVDRNYYRSTPVVVNGVLYVSSPFGIVAALDAATGEELWKFDPESWRDQEWFPSTHRGVAYWEEDGAKRVLFGTTDGYFYSLDAESGRPDPAFGDSGRVDLTQGMRREVQRGEYVSVSPPMIYG
ncbi:MAG: PQQ-binding-like beta-propeller repeat protein, partial [Gemmatimonadota bacterium]|nr:PQQ-binding-like beta-propeller repeat protein [Gemmatimonadota bacterium]